MTKLILFFILFYVITKAVRFLIKAFSKPLESDGNPTVNKSPDKKIDIKREDIIEAEFEEIKESKEDKL